MFYAARYPMTGFYHRFDEANATRDALRARSKDAVELRGVPFLKLRSGARKALAEDWGTATHGVRAERGAARKAPHHAAATHALGADPKRTSPSAMRGVRSMGKRRRGEGEAVTAPGDGEV